MAKSGKGRSLVIVESPAKARTIGRYLGADYDVAASVGHVRDLPTNELGVDVEAGFEPTYVAMARPGVVQDLRKRASGADTVILATDPDREGEAIAWHVAELLGWKKKGQGARFRRVEFREITKPAVEKALASPTDIDMRKVEAQQTRRILDRLVGYQVSPFLWKPIRPGLSAGRVQTVALRLICEREDEITAFVSTEYWSVTAHLLKGEQPFVARLQKIDGKAFTLANETEATAVVADVSGLPFRVTDLRTRERRKNPSAPFTTSTLQQEAAKRLGFSAKRTMTTAQRLYEGVDIGSQTVGLITYMRTDSTRVSESAVEAARAWVRREFGDDHLPRNPPSYAGKQASGAQEAHEAVRPTAVERHPDDVRRFLDPSEARLYELIWQRFVASQMAPAIFDTATADFDIQGFSGRRFLFRSTGSVLRFAGFTRLYRDATEAGDHRRLDDEETLPSLEKGDESTLKGLEPKQHFTQPPPRYSEASLVKELEACGIGRPSTYAQIISTITERGYVELLEKRFHPTPLGDTVAKLLVRVFPTLFESDFTSRMERELDRVEEGEVAWRDVLADFYPGFQERLQAGKASSDEIVRSILEAEGEACNVCGRPMLVRWNRFGRFLGCSGYPDCAHTRPLDGDRGESGEVVLGTDDEAGEEILLKTGPYGPYLQCGRGEKPRRVSLPKDRDPSTVDLDYARKLLSFPVVLGADPGSGKPVTAGIGRYGPYVERAGSYRNLRDEAHLFAVNLEGALELLERPQGRAVIREMGEHPSSGVPLRILDGRFGPYVTDGSVNASLPKGSDPEELTIEEALGLLAASAARGGGKKGKGGRKGAASGKATASGKKVGTAKKPAAGKKVGTAKKPAAGKSSKPKAVTGGSTTRKPAATPKSKVAAGAGRAPSKGGASRAAGTRSRATRAVPGDSDRGDAL
jgi:DNA topoisomerase I